MRFALIPLVLGTFVGPVLADVPPQAFTGTPESVSAGGSLPVTFSDPSLAGQVITVTAYDAPNPERVERIIILLDGQGRGVTPLPVPAGWTAIVLQHPASQDYSVLVT